MSITRDLMDTTRIQRTMRVLPYEEAKAATTRFIEGSLEKSDELTGWDLSFEEYIEEHKSSKLLFCWYAQGVAIVFSPSDHHGVWAMQREGVKGKGVLPEYSLEIVERIAKEKTLAEPLRKRDLNARWDQKARNAFNYLVRWEVANITQPNKKHFE